VVKVKVVGRSNYNYRWGLAEYCHSHRFLKLVTKLVKYILPDYHNYRSLIIVSHPNFCHSKDMDIQIDSINFAEVYKFPHKIDTVQHHCHGLDRSNEIPYPLGCCRRFSYNSTAASQGLENTLNSGAYRIVASHNLR
jgi:hypothetical protein